jgi:heme exporter protein D
MDWWGTYLKMLGIVHMPSLSDRREALQNWKDEQREKERLEYKRKALELAATWEEE